MKSRKGSGDKPSSGEILASSPHVGVMAENAILGLSALLDKNTPNVPGIHEVSKYMRLRS